MPLVDCSSQLRDDRLCFGGNSADLASQESNTKKERPQDSRHPDQGNAGIVAARLLKGRDAIGDRFHSGQRCRAAGKGVQDQEQRDGLSGMNHFQRWGINDCS